MAVFPRSVVKRLSSVRIRAKTGKAVIDIATPMKTINGPGLTPLETVWRRTNETPTPSPNGRLIPATAMLRDFLPVRKSEFKSSSSPIMKRKNMSPRFAKVSKVVKLLGGKTA